MYHFLPLFPPCFSFGRETKLLSVHWQSLNPSARPASQLTRRASQTAAAGPVAENKYINGKQTLNHHHRYLQSKDGKALHQHHQRLLCSGLDSDSWQLDSGLQLGANTGLWMQTRGFGSRLFCWQLSVGFLKALQVDTQAPGPTPPITRVLSQTPPLTHSRVPQQLPWSSRCCTSISKMRCLQR